MYQDLFIINRLECIYPKYLIARFDGSSTNFLVMLNNLIQNKEGVLYNDKIYVRKTAKEWAKELMLSERTINRITKKLIDKNAIDVQRLDQRSYNQTNYMTILYENL